MMEHKSYPFYIYISAKLIAPLHKLLDALKDIGELAVRLWVASIFFSSGLSKITDWGSTIVLFKSDSNVPIISPTLAAYLGTGMEFLLPILLVLGLGGRLTIFIFFVYNIICVISFNFLWTLVGRTGLDDHISWGLLLMLMMFYGSGRISLDYLISKRYGHLLNTSVGYKWLWFKR
jgi:putative oxidoreductase